ncbi:MAG TPA: lysophospholipid acyltransferase family protein [Vicinamibacteria bacterium]|nr:lysophospholipid acyltransferase family protein [Vicinamibacteria bacterium]
MTVPVLGPRVPKSGGRLTRPLGRLLLRLTGWRVLGEFPDIAQCVLIVAPHTSNWDFLFGLAAKWALGLRVRFVGKHTLFRFPLGVLMRGVGGIPVDRHSATGFAERVAAEFADGAPLWLVVAPEGTRRRVTRWKSGFHRIAMAARVPILPVALDYASRAVRALPLHVPSGKYAADLRVLAANFTPEMACTPARYAPPEES